MLFQIISFNFETQMLKILGKWTINAGLEMKILLLINYSPLCPNS